MATATGSKAGTLTERQIVGLCQQFSLVGEPTRLRILDVLAEGRRNVGAICDAVGRGEIDQPKISHHLALMRIAGLVDFYRQGKHNNYYAMPIGLVLLAAARRLAETGTRGT